MMTHKESWCLQGRAPMACGFMDETTQAGTEPSAEWGLSLRTTQSSFHANPTTHQLLPSPKIYKDERRCPFSIPEDNEWCLLDLMSKSIGCQFRSLDHDRHCSVVQKTETLWVLRGQQVSFLPPSLWSNKERFRRLCWSLDRTGFLAST